MNKVLSAMLLLILLSAVSQGQMAKDDPFLKAVRKREAMCKVVDIKFRMKEIRPKNSPTPMAELLPPNGKLPKTLDRDLVLESTNRIVLQGDAFSRFEGNHPVWNLASGKPMPDEHVNVTNTKAAKSFYPIGRGTDPQASGAIIPPVRSHAMSMYYMLPVGIVFRGMNRVFTSPSSQLFKPSSHRQQIDGRECLEYALETGNDSRTIYLVDPQRDHNVVRRVFITLQRVSR